MKLSRSSSAVIAILCGFVILVDFKMLGLEAASGAFNMVAAGLVIGLAAMFLFGRGNFSTSDLRRKPVFALAMFLLWGACSMAWSVDIGATIITMLAWMMGVATLYLLAGLPMEKALASMVIALTVMCLGGFAFALVSPDAFMFNQGMMRFRGLLFGPHALSGPAGIGLAILATGRADLRKSFYWVAGAVLAVSVVLTLSRQAYAAVLVAVAAAYYLRLTGMSRPLSLAMVALGVFALLGWDLFNDQSVVGVIPQGEGGDITTLTGRTEIWAAALDLISASPWIGYGFGAGGAALSGYYVKDYGWSTSNTHSAVLQAGLDLGLVGLTLLATLLIYAVRNAVRGNTRVALPLLISVLTISLVERGFYGAGSFISVAFLYVATGMGREIHIVQGESLQSRPLNHGA